MKPILPKQPRLRLDYESYERLREKVLRRDGWKCQSCGTRSNLEVHHREFRSQSGDDSEENLIALCFRCHSRVHRPNDAKQAMWKNSELGCGAGCEGEPRGLCRFVPPGGDAPTLQKRKTYCSGQSQYVTDGGRSRDFADTETVSTCSYVR